ncbi:MAG: hypothetical protein K0Q72_539 [Armatimonadetes bacterium]|nr:hypothetical protein [Armatimonadota bacterium]
MRDELEHQLGTQVPDSRVIWLRIVDKPYFLAGGKETLDDPGQLQVRRASLSVAFQLLVRSPTHEEQLAGVFSWVARDLDTERSDQIYVDLEPRLWGTDRFHLGMKGRLYGVDEAPGELEVELDQQPAPRPWWKFWQR